MGRLKYAAILLTLPLAYWLTSHQALWSVAPSELDEHKSIPNPQCNHQNWIELDIGASGPCFALAQDGHVYHLGETLSPALAPYEQNLFTVVRVSPLSPSGRYALLRVFGYRTPAAVIDLQQRRLLSTVNPLNFIPWVAWTQDEKYGFILNPDDGGGFDSILRIDLSSGDTESWHAISLIHAVGGDRDQYYTLDIETFAIAEDSSQFSIDMDVYTSRYTSVPKRRVRVDVNIETLDTINLTSTAGR